MLMINPLVRYIPSLHPLKPATSGFGRMKFRFIFWSESVEMGGILLEARITGRVARARVPGATDRRPVAPGSPKILP